MFVGKDIDINKFRINGEKISKLLREAGGYKKGVDEILNLIDKMPKDCYDNINRYL